MLLYLENRRNILPLLCTCKRSPSYFVSIWYRVDVMSLDTSATLRRLASIGLSGALNATEYFPFGAAAVAAINVNTIKPKWI